MEGVYNLWINFLPDATLDLLSAANYLYKPNLANQSSTCFKRLFAFNCKSSQEDFLGLTTPDQ